MKNAITDADAQLTPDNVRREYRYLAGLAHEFVLESDYDCTRRPHRCAYNNLAMAQHFQERRRFLPPAPARHRTRALRGLCSRDRTAVAAARGLSNRKM